MGSERPDARALLDSTGESGKRSRFRHRGEIREASKRGDLGPCSYTALDVACTNDLTPSLREFESKVSPGKTTGVLAIIEGTRFWVREDALNKDKNIIDPDVSPPIVM